MRILQLTVVLHFIRRAVLIGHHEQSLAFYSIFYQHIFFFFFFIRFSTHCKALSACSDGKQQCNHSTA